MRTYTDSKIIKRKQISWTATFLEKHTTYLDHLWDNILREQDNLNQLWDNILRERDNLNHLWNNILRERDNLDHLWDNILRERDNWTIFETTFFAATHYTTLKINDYRYTCSYFFIAFSLCERVEFNKPVYTSTTVQYTCVLLLIS
jgi:hypothetical protein